MITAAQLVLDQHGAGQKPDVDAVPAWQWGLRFGELSAICPSRFGATHGEIEKQRNALRVELVHFAANAVRCKEQSPDGRGLAWFLSGGSPLAYGQCCLTGCPRSRRTA